MTESYFEVVLEGTVREGLDTRVTQENLAKLLRVPTEKAVQLLRGKPHVLKRGIDSAMAEKYKAAIEQTGACCRIAVIIPPPANQFHQGGTIQPSTNGG